MNDVTFCVTTFERPESVKACVESIRQFYPEVRVLVGDNSRCPQEIPTTELVEVPFDSGISVTRNALLDRVDTPLVTFLDDDYVFTEATRMELLRPDGVDVVAGMVLYANGRDGHYEGLLEIEDGVLYYRPGTRNGLYDIVFNFFVASTEAIRSIRWDPDLKLAEHTDFFLRAKGHLKVAYEPQVKVRHIHTSPAGYQAYRDRGWDYTRKMLTKHDLVAAVAFDGSRFP